MNSKNIICSTLFVLLIFVGLYIFAFHDGLSNTNGDWGSFGSYIGGIGSLILSIAVMYYTMIENKHNKELILQDKKSEAIRQIVKIEIEYQEYLKFFSIAACPNKNMTKHEIYEQASAKTKEIDSNIRYEFQILETYLQILKIVTNKIDIQKANLTNIMDLCKTYKQQL